MSISIIAKRIDSGPPNGGQGVYARNLLEYMTNPEIPRRNQTPQRIEQRKEKCVVVLCENFSKPVLDYAAMASEMACDCAMSERLLGEQGVDHWVISFNGSEGERPTIDQTLAAAKIWIESMGYGKPFEHKWSAAVHVDTEHTHVHLALCRVNSLTGKVKPRGWWKNDNQRALAQIAANLGLSLEAGARVKVEAVRVSNKDQHAPLAAESQNAPVDEAPLSEEERQLLSERLSRAYHEIRENLPNMKWGQIHMALARRGLWMDKVERKGQPVLAFSLDGKGWVEAAQVCPEMAWEKLDGHIGGKSGWRKRNRVVEEELLKAREEAQKIPPARNRLEIEKGFKSDETILSEKLRKVYEEIRDDLPRMKWGQIHLALARHGLQMDKRDHGSRGGLVFSMDGTHWEPASTICPAMAWDNLDGHIGATGGYRKANAQVLEELVRVWEEELRRQKEQGESPIQPTLKTERDVSQLLSKEDIQALRQLPMDDVRSRLKAAGLKLRKTTKEPVRNALDVAIREANLSYAAACQKLAELYPEVIEAGREIPSYSELVETLKTTTHPGIHEYKPGEAGYEVGEEIVKWWRALQLESINFQGKERKLADVLTDLPQLIEQTEASRLDFLLYEPKWRKGKIGIKVNALFDLSMLKKYPPTAIVNTPDRREQVFWVVDQKYEREFYDDFMRYLNKRHADQVLLARGHGLKMVGLGSGKTQLDSATPRRPVEMEKLIEEYRREWEKKKSKEKPAGPIDPETFKRMLKKVDVPQYLIDTGLRARFDFEIAQRLEPAAQQGADLDRSQVDAATASLLYEAGATPDEVFSYLRVYGSQTETVVTKKNPDGSSRKTRRITSAKDMDRIARETAAATCPPNFQSYDGYRIKNARKDNNAAQVWKQEAPQWCQEFIRQANKRRKKLKEARLIAIEEAKIKAETIRIWREEIWIEAAELEADELEAKAHPEDERLFSECSFQEKQAILRGLLKDESSVEAEAGLDNMADNGADNGPENKLEAEPVSEPVNEPTKTPQKVKHGHILPISAAEAMEKIAAARAKAEAETKEAAETVEAKVKTKIVSEDATVTLEMAAEDVLATACKGELFEEYPEDYLPVVTKEFLEVRYGQTTDEADRNENIREEHGHPGGVDSAKPEESSKPGSGQQARPRVVGIRKPGI